MAACLNGIAAHGGLRPFGSTFLVFSDYMKPAIRLAAIMRLPVIYIGTHDSIGLGEDGPTHQPVEHLAMLRAIPTWSCSRPADAGETIEAWRVAMARRTGPTLLVLTRQKLPVLDRASLGAADGAARGAYVLLGPSGRDSAGDPDRHRLGGPRRARRGQVLQADRVRVRVVSMPSWELFAAQPRGLSRRGAAAGRASAPRHRGGGPFGWERWITEEGATLAMEGFGASAPGDRLFQEFKFTARARRGDGPAAARAEVRMTGTPGPHPNPLVRLGELGQSPWYDYITRDLVATGELARLIGEDGLRGMTSNPTIFEKAVAGSRLYDADIRPAGRRGPERARDLRGASPSPTSARPATPSARSTSAPAAATAWSRWRSPRRWPTTPTPRSTRPSGSGARWTGPTR